MSTPSITQSLLSYAKASNFPVTLRDGQRTFVYFPHGDFMSCDEVNQHARNRSFAVHPDAVRSPGVTIRRSNDMCTVWFAWFDGALHGQFKTEQEAIDAMLA